MKTIDGSSKIKLLMMIFIGFILMIGCYGIKAYTTYKSIDIKVSGKPIIEYGSANYKIEDLVDDVEGKIVSIKKDIDTNMIGRQKIVVEVKKDFMTKEVPIIVDVKDTIAPTITIKEEKITITQGDEFNVQNNISNVADKVDGNIEYKEQIPEEKNNYYTVECNEDLNAVGNHIITVKAVDNNGNISMVNYQLEVLEPEPEPEPEPAPEVQAKVEEEVVPTEPVYANLPANGAAGDIVSIAYSLLNSPYVAGGNTPAGFDCSGFVQYVYSLVGISVSRSSSTQIYDGVAVSYENAQPGDILSWGAVDGYPTHSAIYIGNGQMIHATNPRQGVIVSDVANWTRYSGIHILSVRRIL